MNIHKKHSVRLPLSGKAFRKMQDSTRGACGMLSIRDVQS